MNTLHRIQKFIVRRLRADVLPQLSFSMDVHAILARRKQIALIWSVEDVLDLRSDLTTDQAWQVLQVCKRSHDCNHGITWETLQFTADEEYPEPERPS